MKCLLRLALPGLLLASAFVLHGEENFFEVKKDRGVPRIFRNGKVVPSRIFLGSFRHGHFAYAREAVPREFGYASRIAGVDIFEGHGDLLWREGDLEKMKKVNRETADRFFGAHPGGFMSVRILTTPPAWWFERHPEVRSRWNNGKSGLFNNQSLPALASELYQREVADALRRTIRFYEETYPGRIAGYHIAGLHTSEWVYDTFYLRELEGYDPSTRTGFRRYLAEKYRTDAALRQAWRDPSATLAAAEVPTHAERIGNGRDFLREPAVDRKLLDFFEFHTELVSTTICNLARVARAE